MTKKEFARCYHSDARVEWVKSLPCAVPGCRNQGCDNHHVKNGGMGRKADSIWIIPLCKGLHGHHRLGHAIGWKTLGKLAGVDWIKAAERTEQLWQEVQRVGTD